VTAVEHLYHAGVDIEMRNVAYDHADAVLLTEQVQREYVTLYGGPDITPMAPPDFHPPAGAFLVGYLDSRPVAMGGWRSREASVEGFAYGDAEIKRMYVVRELRGRGLARRVLGALEASAARVGRARMVLETGTKQPEAISLYTSCGYLPIPKFGVYRHMPSSVCLGRSLGGADGTPDGLRAPSAAR
jgi:GNAT superfamily N-acetyltransferase